jgi:hypothetical protein
MTTKEWAVGNFCMFPRVGALVARPVEGWTSEAWTRAANALGLSTESGGVVVGTVQGYGPHRSREGERAEVVAVEDWCARHPEAAKGPRVKAFRPGLCPVAYAEWRMKRHAALVARVRAPRKPWEREDTSMLLVQDRQETAAAIRWAIAQTRALPLP